MKIEFNKKYTTIAVYVCICLIIALAIYFVGTNFSSVQEGFNNFTRILAPVGYGLIIAYIANPLMCFFENKVFGLIKKKGVKRATAILASFLVIASLIAMFIMLLLPQIVSSCNELYNYSLKLVDKITKEYESFVKGNKNVFSIFPELTNEIKNIITSLPKYLADFTQYLFTNFSAASKFVVALFNGFMNFFLGVVFAIYFLASKEKLCAQIKKFCRSIIPSDKAYNELYDLALEVDEKFGSFIRGKIVDSIIIGVIIFVVLGIIGMPYYPAISVIMCLSNLIPFIGPIIGAVPCAFIVLIANPIYCIIFLVFVLVIQQFDANYLEPKIVGNAVGLSSLWVLFAITVMGGFFGVIGMLIASPTFAVIYSLLKRFSENRLKKCGLPSETSHYLYGSGEVVENTSKTDTNEK